MKMSQIFPESCYTFKALSRSEVVKACESNLTVTGHVEKILADTQELLVTFGNNLIAYLPFSEVSIYDYEYSKNPNRPLPINVCILLGKNIRTKVVEVTDNRITLSRKKNMEEAYQYLTTCTSCMFHVTSLSVFNAFGDIGDGITARLNIREVSRARIRNIGEAIRKGDTMRVILLDYDHTKRFRVSYKQTYKEFSQNDFFEGMAVRGVVNEPVNKTYKSFFVTLSPQISGILEVNSWAPELRYGDVVDCAVSKVTEKGVTLTFLKLIE